MSAICQNFVQNAWKKELCSNCFKSKDEHTFASKVKPLTLIANKTVESIIKTDKPKPKRSVCFTSELSQVIGYGGEDWSSDNENSDTEDDGTGNDNDFENDDEINDEERELYKLTKENTDFNSTSLKDEVKKSYTQLMLGKPQIDSEGRKQTLLVSVTPFGQENTAIRKYPKAISHIPIAKNKEAVPEIKSPNVILTSYTKNEPTEEKSLLDEISETLENSKNPIQIITRKKTEKDVVLSIVKPEDNNENSTQDINIKNTEEKIRETKMIKTNITERKNGLTRAPVIIKRDQEKPVVYQTSTAKIELLNTKNLKFHGSKDNLSAKINKAESDIKLNKTEQIILENNVRKYSKEEKESDVVSNKTNSVKVVQNLPEIIQDLRTKTDDGDSRSTESSCTESDSLESSSESNKVLGLPPPIPKYNGVVFPQSRELAGEPDGRADPDESPEPPALPLTPPPHLEVQASFLHGTPPQQEKPKVPSKPTNGFIRKPPAKIEAQNNLVLSTFNNDIRNTEVEKMKLTKQDSNNSDSARVGNKRRAPRPPEESNAICERNLACPLSFDSPVAREIEKRERASSCSPKLRKASDGDHSKEEANYASIPEPVPRKSLSMSTDSLAVGEEKRKDKAKNRFSLKKFLRMGGSSKDVQKLNGELLKHDVPDAAPQPKPRLVIVHPQDLTGTKVEVVSKPVIPENAEYSVPINMMCTSNCTEPTCNSPRTTKPPPPPRNLEDCNRVTKPVLPTPPKSAEILHKQRQLPRTNATKKVDSVYANIGEVRTALKPHKPQRTASMREREALQEKQKKVNENYEQINPPNHNGNSKDGNENVYDYISGRSSSPEYDSGPDKNTTNEKVARPNGLLKQKSESHVDVSGDCFKFNNIPRSLSLTYCGSETESEIYSPYSFCGSESEVSFFILLSRIS